MRRNWRGRCMNIGRSRCHEHAERKLLLLCACGTPAAWRLRAALKCLLFIHIHENPARGPGARPRRESRDRTPNGGPTAYTELIT